LFDTLRAAALGYAEKVRSQLLSLRQQDLGCRTPRAREAENPADFADIFVRENSAGGFCRPRLRLENAIFSVPFVPSSEVRLPFPAAKATDRGHPFSKQTQTITAG
jgi:hypothetical protein